MVVDRGGAVLLRKLDGDDDGASVVETVSVLECASARAVALVITGALTIDSAASITLCLYSMT